MWSWDGDGIATGSVFIILSFGLLGTHAHMHLCDTHTHTPSHVHTHGSIHALMQGDTCHHVLAMRHVRVFTMCRIIVLYLAPNLKLNKSNLVTNLIFVYAVRGITTIFKLNGNIYNYQHSFDTQNQHGSDHKSAQLSTTTISV